MIPKRMEQDDTYDFDGRLDDTPVVAHVLRAPEPPADAPREKKDDEKLSLFWRVFGGTILSIVALVAVTLYNNISSGQNELRAEFARINEARADLIRKDEFNSRLSGSYERLQALQQQNNTQNAALTSQKTEIDGLKERLAKAAADVDTVRKESALALDGMKRDQSATTEAIKKDVAALELVKERMTTLATEFKAARDDLSKMRHDVDKNQAYDLERRDRRDGQFKQIDEAVKEFQKGLQDCREKLARLEGQYGPPQPAGPAAPKKASAPRPATPVKPAGDPTDPG